MWGGCYIGEVARTAKGSSGNHCSASAAFPSCVFVMEFGCKKESATQDLEGTDLSNGINKLMVVGVKLFMPISRRTEKFTHCSRGCYIMFPRWWFHGHIDASPWTSETSNQSVAGNHGSAFLCLVSLKSAMELSAAKAAVWQVVKKLAMEVVIMAKIGFGFGGSVHRRAKKERKKQIYDNSPVSTNPKPINKKKGIQVAHTREIKEVTQVFLLGSMVKEWPTSAR